MSSILDQVAAAQMSCERTWLNDIVENAVGLKVHDTAGSATASVKDRQKWNGAVSRFFTNPQQVLEVGGTARDVTTEILAEAEEGRIVDRV